MTKKIILVTGFLLSFSFFNHAMDTLPTQPTQIFGEYVWHQSYQDQIVNNQVIIPGRVSYLTDRYDAIKKIAQKYQRPITVLDIGASQGYYSFRLAHDFKNSTCVMIEEDKYLQRLCLLNTNLNNIIFLHKKITAAELKRLGECEHFDIVLALNIIHWSEEKWHEIADAIVSLGDRIIVETPPAGDKAIGAPYLGDIEKYFENKGAKIILKNPRHTGTGLFANMYLLTQTKRYITRSSWLDTARPYAYKIHSTLKEKGLMRTIINQNGEKKIVEIPWKCGINLLTFKMLNGIFPVTEILQKSLLHLDGKELWFKEPIISNFIIQGNALCPIDASLPFAQINNDFNIVQQYVKQLLNMTSEQIAQLESPYTIE